VAVTNGGVDREGGWFLRATDRMRMGYLYLHDGWMWGGKQVGSKRLSEAVANTFNGWLEALADGV
jgi:hypothetical protein